MKVKQLFKYLQGVPDDGAEIFIKYKYPLKDDSSGLIKMMEKVGRVNMFNIEYKWDFENADLPYGKQEKIYEVTIS